LVFDGFLIDLVGACLGFVFSLLSLANAESITDSGLSGLEALRSSAPTAALNKHSEAKTSAMYRM
jgi:hypothetical protein